MLRWFLRRQVAAFERSWNYDASYLRALVAADQGDAGIRKAAGDRGLS